MTKDSMEVGDRVTIGNVEATVESVNGFAPQKIKQNRGPTLEFSGKLLASTEWEARDGQMRLELWQTAGGALIPVTRSDFGDGRRAIVSAAVVGQRYAEQWAVKQPEDALIDEAGMQFACLDFWDWTDRARSMVRDQLGWSLVREIA